MYSWTTILSPRSLTALSSPLMLYYKSYLAVAIGSTLTEKVICYSYAFSARITRAATRTKLFGIHTMVINSHSGAMEDPS